MDVGSLTITSLYDARIAASPHRMYALSAEPGAVLPGSRGLAEQDWDLYQRFLAAGQIELDFGGFLVSGSGDRLVLVNLGIGPSSWVPEPEFTPRDFGRLPQSLAAAGYTPGDVTDVVFTHLHFDHLGWASHEGRPMFPNATYRCHAADLAYFYPSDEHVAQALGPVESRIETWERDETLSAGIEVRPVPGHTPGSSIVVLSSAGERAMLVGDAAHCPVDLLDPEWAGLADAEPALAREVRITLARESEQAGVPIAAAHFPGLRFGRLLRQDGGALDFRYLS